MDKTVHRAPETKTGTKCTLTSLQRAHCLRETKSRFPWSVARLILAYLMRTIFLLACLRRLGAPEWQIFLSSDGSGFEILFAYEVVLLVLFRKIIKEKRKESTDSGQIPC